MKILLAYPPPKGGVKRYTESLIEALNCARDNLEIYHFVGGNATGDVNNLEYSVFDELKNNEVEKRFINILDEIKPDIVNFQELAGIGASLVGIAKDKGFPTILTLHDYWTICPRFFLLDTDWNYCSGPNFGLKCTTCFDSKNLDKLQRDLMLRYDMLNKFMKKVDYIITVSESLRKKIIEHGIEETKVITVYPSLEIKVNTHLPKIDRSLNKIRLAYIGAIQPHKGLHVAIEAFKRIPADSAELHIYGYMDRLYRRTIDNLVKNIDNIFINGSYDSKELSNIFSQIDVLLVPSIVPETGPLVVQEALRHKIPVIGSNIGGIPEYVNESYGALFEAGNINNLEEILIKTINNPELVKQWQNNIPDLSTMKQFGESILMIYDNAKSLRKEEWSIDKNNIKFLKRESNGFLRRQFIQKNLIKISDYLLTNQYFHIAIFGAGKLGEMVSNYLLDKGIITEFFLDNDQNKWGKTIGFKSINNPRVLREEHDIDFVFVVSDWEIDIIEMLIKMDLKIPFKGLYGGSWD